MDKVSIVIPAYNGDEYIEKCIISAIDQTYGNIEVIIVNDGSTDNTADVCGKYVSDRVRLITIPNGGPGNARNIGAAAADGDWIMFIDSDDYVDPEICSKLVELAGRTGAEIAFCNLGSVSAEGPVVPLVPFNGNERVFCGEDLKHLEYMLAAKESETADPPLCLSGPVCKIIRKELYKSEKFPADIDLGEDTCYVLSLLSKSTRAAYTGETLYYRVIHDDSLSYSGINEDRLSGYTNWVIRNYYGKDYFRGAANRLNALNMLWIIAVYMCGAGYSCREAAAHIKRYEAMLEHRLTLREIRSCAIPQSKKLLLIMQRAGMYSALWAATSRTRKRQSTGQQIH